MSAKHTNLDKSYIVVKKEVTSEDEDDAVGLLVDSSLKSYHQVYKEALEGSVASSDCVKSEESDDTKYEHVICIKEEMIDEDDDHVFKCNECQVFSDSNELMLHVASHRNKRCRRNGPEYDCDETYELVETSSVNGECFEFENDKEITKNSGHCHPVIRKFYNRTASSEDDENKVEIIRTSRKRKTGNVEFPVSYLQKGEDDVIIEKLLPEKQSKEHLEKRIMEIIENEMNKEKELSDEDQLNGKKIKMARSGKKSESNIRNSKHVGTTCEGFIPIDQLSPRKSSPLNSKSMVKKVEPMSVLHLTLFTDKLEEKKKEPETLKHVRNKMQETTTANKNADRFTTSRKVEVETFGDGLLQCKECSVTFEQKSLLVMHELSHEKYKTYKRPSDEVQDFHIRTAKPADFVYIRNSKEVTCNDNGLVCQDKPAREVCKVQSVDNKCQQVRIYPCKYCHLKFSLKNQLHMHELIHKKEKNKECRCNSTDGTSDLCLCIVRKCQWCSRSFFSSKKLKNWRLCISCYLIDRSKENSSAASLLRVQNILEDMDSKRLCFKCGKMCDSVLQCGGSWICHSCWSENVRYITYPQLRDTSHRTDKATKLFPRQLKHQCLHESDDGEEMELGQHFLLAGYDPVILQERSDDDDEDWSLTVDTCDNDNSDSSHMVVLCDKTGELIDLTATVTS